MNQSGLRRLPPTATAWPRGLARPWHFTHFLFRGPCHAHLLVSRSFTVASCPLCAIMGRAGESTPLVRSLRTRSRLGPAAVDREDDDWGFEESDSNDSEKYRTDNSPPLACPFRKRNPHRF